MHPCAIRSACCAHRTRPTGPALRYISTRIILLGICTIGDLIPIQEKRRGILVPWLHIPRLGILCDAYPLVLVKPPSLFLTQPIGRTSPFQIHTGAHIHRHCHGSWVRE
jgi:hypothetical protein